MSLKQFSIPEEKKVTITSKRQVTIPQKYYKAFGFEKEAVFRVINNNLVLMPLKQPSGGEFAEQILAELIAEGLSGETLLDEFRIRQSRIRPAVERMIETAHKAAGGEEVSVSYEDIFSEEE